VSTCMYADRMAELSIKTYKLICSESLRDSFKQTVLASVILRVEIGEIVTCHVIALGVGTKYLSKDLLGDANNKR
jgi:hypothetical protein